MFSVVNLISGILGMFVAGALIDIFGKIKMLRIYLAMLIVLLVSAALAQPYWENRILIISFVSAFYILTTFTTIAIFAAAMNLCWKRISATQFTLYMAISNLGLASGAWLMGILSEWLSWEYIIAIAVIFPLVMLILTPFIHFENHTKKVEMLDHKYEIPVDESKLKETA